ncbi:stage V sporulation protein AC [Dehalobacterium formicoaceticum]|uniref:Stage V sporulation protein AC n=1 Tax=Dehalobacterium formicoaceticum TaxID=51515 RepID=A0ABT1Y5W2_9FIRM|nr:stage V sporulation protein AC [Dehalobacterium formicoaceticum]MCR6546270.1 stage V sporulation protein AC [Dehalobacterium formicoaceticum]
MSNKKKKKLAPVQQEYQKLVQKQEPKRPVFINCLRAFIAGGTICLIGQGVQTGFIRWGGFEQKEAGNPTVAVMIILSTLLTTMGLYDKIAQWAGAGTAVPVTGFANTMTSSALEHKSEGMVLGVGGKMFELAGPVIVFGTVAAFIMAMLHWIFEPGIGGLM